jgi:hypothetical protein
VGVGAMTRRSADTVSIIGGSGRPRGSKTLCIPCQPEYYGELEKDPKRFRRYVDQVYAQNPELFPAAMSAGYRCHDIRLSVDSHSRRLPGAPP